jgi:hypothetical protein
VTGKTQSELNERGGPDFPWVVDEGVNSAQDWAIVERDGAAKIVQMSQLVDTPARMTPAGIVSAAKGRGGQWLCVSSAQTEYQSQDRSSYQAVQLLTLGFAPTVSDAKSEIEMIVIDLRDDSVVDQWRGTETGWQPAIGWTLKDASRQTADRAETRALRTVLARVDALARGEHPDAKSRRRSSRGMAE